MITLGSVTRYQGSAASLRRHVAQELAQPSAEVMRIELQPIVDLDTGAVVGHEALSRIDVNAEAVRPESWFEAGRDLSLGTVAGLESRAAQLAVDAARGVRGLLAINFSPDTMAELPVRRTLDRLQAFQATSGRRVAIELSEKGHLHDAGRLRHLVLSLRERGFVVAVDDAGTGYAQEEFVRQVLTDRLGPDDHTIVKIDASHSDIRRGANDRFVRRFAAMAVEHGADLVVEGVSSREVLSAIKGLQSELGSTTTVYGQGHWLSQNLTGPDAPALVPAATVAPQTRGLAD